MIITILIIATTVITSILAFSNRDHFYKLMFNAYLIQEKKQWYRFLSYGLIHADWFHLFINMFVLYSFGSLVEQAFGIIFGMEAKLYYLLLYIGGIAFSTLFDFGKHKNNPHYNAVGASGAVSAILFSSILIMPQGSIGLLFIPIPIPSPVFGILYLVYSAYMAKRGKDNIGHNAHFWGAIYGIILTIALKPSLAKMFFDYISGFFG